MQASIPALHSYRPQPLLAPRFPHRMPRPTQPFRAGAIAWVLAVQFFITQVVTGTAWSRAFSLKNDYISDLGNTSCGAYPAGSTHMVKPKETFYSISRKYHVSVDTLMKLNGYTDPGRLREGVTLKVPGKQ